MKPPSGGEKTNPIQTQFLWIPAGFYPAQSLPRTEFIPHGVYPALRCGDAGMRGCGAGMTNTVSTTVTNYLHSVRFVFFLWID